MGKRPATAGEKPGCSSRRVEAKIKHGSLGNLSKIVPEDTEDVRAKPKLQLHCRWLPGRVGLCRGRGCSGCWSRARRASGLFCARAFRLEKPRGTAQEKFACEIPSAERPAAGSAASLVSCPAGTPRYCFADGLYSIFPFISSYFCLRQILHQMRGSTAAKVCIGECSSVAYSDFLSIFCLLLRVQALKITGYFKPCCFVPRLSTAGCQLEREGGEVSGPCREFSRRFVVLGTACHTPGPESCPCPPREALSLQVLSRPPHHHPNLTQRPGGAAAGLRPRFAACRWVPLPHHVPRGLLPVPRTTDPCPRGHPFPTLPLPALQQNF